MSKEHQASSEIDQLSLHFAFEAECFALGCVLRNGWASWEQIAVLDAEDFGFERHRKLFKYMRKLATNQVEPVFSEIFTQILQRAMHEKQDTAGGSCALYGFPDLAELHAWGIDDARLIRICEHIRRRRIDRQAFKLAEEIREATMAGYSDHSAEIAKSQRELEKLESSLTIGQKSSTVGAIIERVGGLDALFARPQGIIQWPVDALNYHMNGGLAPGTVTVVAARPANGKSALALQVIARAVRRNQRAVLFSMEMLEDELMKRLIAQNSNVSLSRLVRGELGLGERAEVRRVIADLDQLPLDLICGPVNISQIVSHCLNAKHKYDLVVMDYLGLIEVTGRFGTRQEAVQHISQTVKKMAMSLKIPAILVAQLKRPEKENAKPYLGDLRESGAIEQDANNVVFIHKPDPKIRNEFELIIAKQRNGPGEISVKVKFEESQCRFLDPEDRVETREGRLFEV